MNTVAAATAGLRQAPTRDPAWLGRVFWTGAGLVLLWPMLVATEFRPWILFEASNLKVTGQFLASFLPPAHSAEFLVMVARETWRTVAIATAGLTLALLLAWPLTLLSTRVVLLLAWRLSDVLLLLFGAVIVAVALRAFAAPLERHLKMRARLAVSVAVIVAMVVLALGTWLIGDRLVTQTDDLRQRLPAALAALVTWARGHPVGLALLQLWDSANAGDVPWSRVANVATQTLGAVGSIGLMAVVGIYLAADPALYREGLVRPVPAGYRAAIDGALLASGHALSRWLLGQGISMLFVGSATAIGLALLDTPLALTIGVIAGVLAFIPFFGPIASGILAVLLAFMQGPTQALYVAALCVAIQQIEGNLLMPFVQRWAVELPPVLGITAAVIFGLLFGLPGVILATPLMVVVMVLVQKLYVEGVLHQAPSSPSGNSP